MSRSPQSQILSLPGPAGKLEAILETPGEGEILGAAVVCHPHPQHGGTMHNKVAHTLARAFVRSGYVALRFNFRGTEGSDGEYDAGNGELDDALAAMQWLGERHPDGPLWLGGFSFGAAIAVRAAVASPVDGLVSVAPALHRIGVRALSVERALTPRFVQPQCPWLVIQGDEDELVEVDETIEWINSLEPGPELLVVAGAEHFFHGRLNELRTAVMDFVATA